jgi:GNAT superfamily N-acetyltransferase
MTLKIATHEDVPHIERMINAFALDSIYRGVNIHPTKISRSVLATLDKPNEEAILILTMDGDKPVGVIGGLVTECMFNDDLMAFELIFYIDEEYRKSNRAVKLLQAYEFWAKKMKCTQAQVNLVETDDADRIEKLYKRKGFSRMERVFLKEL